MGCVNASLLNREEWRRLVEDRITKIGFRKTNITKITTTKTTTMQIHTTNFFFFLFFFKNNAFGFFEFLILSANFVRLSGLFFFKSMDTSTYV